jgi:hypothetical protein
VALAPSRHEAAVEERKPIKENHGIDGPCIRTLQMETIHLIGFYYLLPSLL